MYPYACVCNRCDAVYIFHNTELTLMSTFLRSRKKFSELRAGIVFSKRFLSDASVFESYCDCASRVTVDRTVTLYVFSSQRNFTQVR